MADRVAIVAPGGAAALRLAGRKHELAVLRTQLAGLLSGRGGLVLIGGEAGIGKTTLVEALACEATARGVLAPTGGCYDLTDTPPYGPWLELADAWPVEAGATSPFAPLLTRQDDARAGSQQALFSAVRDSLAVEAQRRPLVLILEDLHWADPASIELLRRLSREASTLPMLLVATYRTEEVDRRHPLYTTLPLLISEARAVRVDLHPLDDEALGTLLAARYALLPSDLARLLAYLQARGEGNPFFVRELLRDVEATGILHRVTGRSEAVEGGRWELGDLGATSLPALLRQVLDRRLDRLAEDDRRLLGVAAVIGQEVPIALWSDVAIVEEEALLDVVERGVAADVLIAPSDGTTARFTHALIREALYEGLLAPRRRAWHRRVGEALLARPAADPDAIAYHFRQAGDERAAEWLVRSGERAQAAYAWLTAAERYDAALAQLESNAAAAGERARLLLILAQLRRYTAPEWGIAQLIEAERLARTAGDAALAAAARFDRGHLHCMAREFEGGLAEMEVGLAGLEALPPAERARVPSLAVLGVRPEERQRYHRGVLVLFFAVLGRLAEAQASSASPSSPVAGTTARELLGRAWVHAALGQPEQARQAFAAARIGYGDQHWEVGTTFFYELDAVVLRYETDHLAERWRLADQAESAWRRASGALPDLSPRLARLPLLVLEGHWQEAHELALATLAAPQSNDAWRRYPGRFLAWLAREEGDMDLAWQLVRDEFPAGPDTQPGTRWFLPALDLQRLAARLAIDAGDLPAARRWLEAYDRWLGWSGAVLGQAEGHLAWAAYACAAGDPTQAQQHAEHARAAASSPRQPLALLAAHRMLGELAAGEAKPGEAMTHLEAALQLADACTAPYERALTLLSIAAVRRAEGDRAGLEPLLAEVRTICGPLGAHPALARAAALSPHPVTVRRGRYPDALSVREVEVLVLISTGRSNREIAQQLCLSVRTVERHINNLYRKIDARGRLEAAAYAARHDLVPEAARRP